MRYHPATDIQGLIIAFHVEIGSNTVENGLAGDDLVTCRAFNLGKYSYHAGVVMHEVGHYLQIEALKRADPEKDLFARSAYNRYYYSIFLTARNLLSLIDSKYERLPHKSYPEVLLGNIVSTLKKGGRTASKNGDHALVTKIASAVSAANDLSNLMEAAYATRIAADYMPSIKVNFVGPGRFELQGISITDAHNWTARAATWCRVILDAWRQVDV